MAVVSFRVCSYLGCEALELVLAVKPEFSMENYPVAYGISLFGRAVRTAHHPDCGAFFVVN